jgi:hypothetical protein
MALDKIIFSYFVRDHFLAKSMYNRVTSTFSKSCHVGFFCLVGGEINNKENGVFS